jgi:hypothetical protein
MNHYKSEFKILELVLSRVKCFVDLMSFTHQNYVG